MKQEISLYEFCGIVLVDRIEEHTDLLKTLFKNAESYNLDFMTAREADTHAIYEIDLYASVHFGFSGEALNAIRDIFYDIYRTFVSAYISMELHCHNLEESDMDSTLCGIVRDYFHF